MHTIWLIDTGLCSIVYHLIALQLITVHAVTFSAGKCIIHIIHLAALEASTQIITQEEQRDLANTIRVSGSILLSTVSNFLDYFKLEAGKRLDIVRREVNLQQLVTDVHCIIEVRCVFSAHCHA